MFIIRLPDPSRLGAFVTGYCCVIYTSMSTYATHAVSEQGRLLHLISLYLFLVIGAALYYKLVRRDPGLLNILIVVSSLLVLRWYFY